ncbi:MAG: transposase [Psychroserpens sp.]|jgi:transposase
MPQFTALMTLKIKEWDLYILFLPTYSPQLNLIETLWRMRKYKWLKARDYFDMDTLLNAIESILLDIGKNLKINFREIKHFTQYNCRLFKENYL